MSLMDRIAALRALTKNAPTPAAEPPAENPEGVDPAVEGDDSQAADPAEIARVCVAAGCAGMIEGLIKDGATMAEVEAMVDVAGQLRAAAADGAVINPALAGALSEMAEASIANCLPVQQVRTAMINMLAMAQSPEINGTHSAAAPQDFWDQAYARARGERPELADAHGWGKAIERASRAQHGSPLEPGE